MITLRSSWQKSNSDNQSGFTLGMLSAIQGVARPQSRNLSVRRLDRRQATLYVADSLQNSPGAVQETPGI
jgi:hypothetical protein